MKKLYVFLLHVFLSTPNVTVRKLPGQVWKNHGQG